MTPMVAPPIMDPIPVGASETAYFVGTVETTTDGDADALRVTLTARDGYPDRDWASVVGGNVVLTDEAGGCIVIITGEGAFDFAGASGIPDAPDFVTVGFGLRRNGGGQVVGVSSDHVVTDGSPTYKANAHAGGVLIVGGTLSIDAFAACYDGDGNPAIRDGAAVCTAVVNVTRLAPGPVLP